MGLAQARYCTLRSHYTIKNPLRCFSVVSLRHSPARDSMPCSHGGQDLTFYEFRTRLLASDPERGMVAQIHVNFPNDRPFVYLDTSRMGLLYKPHISDGNTSTKFVFVRAAYATSSLSAHKKEASATAENPVSFYLQSQVVKDAMFKVSSEPTKLETYDLTLQVTNAPTVLVAQPSPTNPNLFAMYTKGGRTQRTYMYLIPNITEKLQNPRKRTITAQIVPNPRDISYVFGIHIIHPENSISC